MYGDMFKLMSKTLNESYFKEDVIDNNEVDEKEVFKNDNGVTYEVMERSASGKNALLRQGNKWIVAWNCPQNSGSWGQGHYFFDEKSARETWNKKYANE